MTKRFLFPIVFMLFSFAAAHAVELTGSLSTHDPSRIIKEGSKYWFYSTGNGIVVTYSENLTSWKTKANPVFPVGTWPDWINTAVPEFAGHFWAPDIIFMNGAYYLYYSCSTWGSSRSAIGVARSFSLIDPEWTDLGMVVSSNGTSTAINAIDPGLFRDDDGKTYMVYGSWFGGIGIVEIDTVDGMATTGTTKIYGGNHQSIEAANMIKEGSYYYLIVNRGNCCDGVNSTYYITVGRSENILGPYEGFGTLLQTDGRYIGPGHFGPLYDSCATYVSIHYYDGNAGGASKLDILKMTFYDQWPELTRNFTFANCGATGIHMPSEPDDDAFLNVYPNPSAKGPLSVDLPDEFTNGTVSVEIFSLDGKQLWQNNYTGIQTVNIDFTLKKGIYLLQVKSGSKICAQKLAVQ
jgi:arabinan endo-1,5-alpha-L-arabinosidase